MTWNMISRNVDEKCRHQDTKSQRPINLKCFLPKAWLCHLCLRAFVAKVGVFGRVSSNIKLSFALLAALGIHTIVTAQTLEPVVPKDKRGDFSYEREGTHDANNIRTFFKSYGMVGGFYDQDPANVDLSVFHSVEIPKGSGMNYSDGVTPFVLAKISQTDGSSAWIMETGYRERQIRSPRTNLTMKFEPRPGYFQVDPSINRDRSPAMSNLPRTWPDQWVDRMKDTADAGWKGSWNGYFGKKPAADQESFFVMDDDYYDAWSFQPDSRDATRHGLGLRIEVRGFQWANPQAGNVIFWHYDIANEGTTDYNDNIIFGLYMDSGVGGSSVACPPAVNGESDDDNAYYDKSLGLNLVYTWDKNGTGRGKDGCAPTGYLGYAYLETPGKSYDKIDNDDDGIIDEARDSGPGQKIMSQQAILDYINGHPNIYNAAKFEKTYGPIKNRPAYKAGVWWTGDEDMDWVAELHDKGADGIGPNDLGYKGPDEGEGDGKPTSGEQNFDKTDLHESDQIGLTSFKFNHIKSGPPEELIGVTFYYDGQKHWPKILYEVFSLPPGSPGTFDTKLSLDENIAFLFASGPFHLEAGRRERFSLALAYGANQTELKTTIKIVQEIYNVNYQFATPPPMPILKAESGNHYVRLSWDDGAERSIDPITYINDFEGYRIYRATDPEFRDVKVITNAQGTGPMVFGKPLVQFDLKDGKLGYSKQIVDGVAYYLGDDTGIRHSFTDTTVTNGQTYFYAVTSYDYGVDSLGFYPSENAITVSQTLRGGIVLPQNVVEVRPEPKVSGYIPAETGGIRHTKGKGVGTVSMTVLNSALVPDNRAIKLIFKNTKGSTNVRADYYQLVDSASGTIYLDRGNSFYGGDSGQVGAGVMPLIKTSIVPTIDSANTGFTSASTAKMQMKATYLADTVAMRREKRHSGYPNDIRIVFSKNYIDTSIAFDVDRVVKPTKFSVLALNNDGTTQRLKFAFEDKNNDSTLSASGEVIQIADTTYLLNIPPIVLPNFVWQIEVDTVVALPKNGDEYFLRLHTPFSDYDEFTFTTKGQKVDAGKAKNDFKQEPYVVPNPYVGAASFEPSRFAISGRGERRMEFRGLPTNCTVRIYTVKGELVQTLQQDGSNNGYIPWNLRTKDNLDVAPGLYIFHVDGKEAGTYIGKFAIIK